MTGGAMIKGHRSVLGILRAHSPPYRALIPSEN